MQKWFEMQGSIHGQLHVNTLRGCAASYSTTYRGLLGALGSFFLRPRLLVAPAGGT